MKSATRGSDYLGDEERGQAIKEIISYFHTELDQEIGVIAAGNILDFFAQTAGDRIYNKAIEDARRLLAQRIEGLDIEMDLLKRTIDRGRQQAA